MEENNKQAQENLISETPPQPETTGIQTPITTGLKQKSPILILFLIVAFIAIGVVGYFGYENYILKNQKTVIPPPPEPPIKPTDIPGPTADYEQSTTSNKLDVKTFTNDKFKFAFDYPSMWISETNKWGFALIKSPDFAFKDTNSAESWATSGAYFDYDFPTPVISTMNLIENQIIKGTDVSTDKRIFNIKKITVSGYPATEWDFQSVQQPDLIGSKVEIEKETPGYGKYLSLEIVYSSNSFKKIFDQILSTFKFTQ